MKYLAFLLLLAFGLTACTKSQGPAGPTELQGEQDDQQVEVEMADSSSIADRAVLVAFYEATNGADWGNNTNWLSDEPLDQWHGVTIDDDGRVQELNLAGNQLTGSISLQLVQLNNLQTLNLAENQLTGSIPLQLVQLNNLQTLNLAGNQLTGCIIDGLREVPDNDLDQLGLPRCTDRAILVAFYEATNGDNWRYNTNWLSDEPLDQWHGVTTDDDGRLEWLYLDENRLTGSIPPELGQLSNLRRAGPQKPSENPFCRRI